MRTRSIRQLHSISSRGVHIITSRSHKTIFIAFALFLLGLAPSAWSLPVHSLVPGGVAVIPLGVRIDRPAPRATYDQIRVLVVPDSGQWVAVVGIPLSAKLGEHIVELTGPAGAIQIPFKVADKQYQTQHITIENKRMVEPNPDDVARIAKEKPVIDAAFAFWRDDSSVETGFVLPAEGSLTGNFGSRRVFNRQPRAPHSGIDIAAPLGASVKAPAAGTVLETGSYFFNGNTVFVDHGQGLISMFCHLDRIDAAVGQVVKAGDLLGAVGKSGRATGPHLHWTVSLNNARIDPRLFLINQAESHSAR